MFNNFNRFLLLGSVGLLLLSVVLITGCGLEKSSDVNLGKQLFAQKCGSCHGLKNAGTKGGVGPNLDDAFGPAIDSGEGRSTVKDVVLKQIKYPMGKEMPANLVKGADAEAVSEYIAQVAGE